MPDIIIMTISDMHMPFDREPEEKSEQQSPPRQESVEQTLSVEISLRREAEEKLATMDERFQLMVATAENYGFFLIDLSGRIISWNPGARKIFGWSDEEILNQSFAQLFTEEDRKQGVPDQELQHASEHGAADDDRWHLRKDGSEFWGHGITTALKNDTVQGFAKIVRDLTERKQAEERIRQSEEQYRSLVEQVGDYAIFRTDTKGRATTWNQGVKRVLGFEEDEFIGQDVTPRIFIPEDQEKHVPQRELEEAAKTGVANNTRWMMKKDGTHFYAAGMTTALKDDQGQLTGFTKVLQDQTAQKQQADELAEKSQQLADANEQKDQFLAILSHELRNPLAPIRMATELICDEDTQNPVVEEACGILRRQVQVMVRLVNDLLEASRITSGKVRLQKENIDLRAVAKSAVESTRSLIQEYNQHLSTSVPDEAVRLQADPVRIEQVIVNLLTNAAKYTPEGGRIWLTIELENDMAVLRVRDNGEGMDRETMKNLFRLFSQADRSRDSSEGGMGIGLALVRSLVEMHGGTVEAQSEGIGKGSEFVVRLPLSAQPHESQAPTESAPTAPRTLRILVLDDNADAAKLLALLLKAKGFEVRAEHHGAAALETAEDFQPHVILLDIGMPGMNGYEFARRVRGRPGLEDVQLVAITGYGQEMDRQESKEAGINHHLVKPVERNTLTTLLETIQLPPR